MRCMNQNDSNICTLMSEGIEDVIPYVCSNPSSSCEMFEELISVDENLELIASKICSNTEKCHECLLSDGKMCTGVLGITKEMFEKFNQ